MAKKPRERLSREQRRFLAMLGMPAFGISLAYTVMTTYLPVFIERLSGPAVNGLLLGAEGIFALFVPMIIGAWSDSLRTRIGGRGQAAPAGRSWSLCLRGDARLRGHVRGS